MIESLKEKASGERRYYVVVKGDIEGTFDYEDLLPEDTVADYDPFHGYRVLSNVPHYKSLLTRKQAKEVVKSLKRGGYRAVIWDAYKEKPVTEEVKPMSKAEELIKLINEKLEISTDDAKAIGALLKNAAYLGVRVIDKEKDLYAVKISVAGNDIVEIFTKREGNKVVFDKAELDETGIKAFIEWFNEKLKDVLKGGGK